MQRMCHTLARGLFTFPRPLIFSHGPNLFVYVLGRPCERFISTLPKITSYTYFAVFPTNSAGFNGVARSSSSPRVLLFVMHRMCHTLSRGPDLCVRILGRPREYNLITISTCHVSDVDCLGAFFGGCSKITLAGARVRSR